MAVPGLRLPHQKPLRADREESDIPLQETDRVADHGAVLGFFPDGRRGGAGLPELPGAEADDDQRQRFPPDDREVKKMVNEGRFDGTPHAFVAFEGRAHSEHVLDKCKIRTVVEDVIENDEKEEELNQKRVLDDAKNFTAEVHAEFFHKVMKRYKFILEECAFCQVKFIFCIS